MLYRCSTYGMDDLGSKQCLPSKFLLEAFIMARALSTVSSMIAIRDARTRAVVQPSEARGQAHMLMSSPTHHGACQAI